MNAFTSSRLTANFATLIVMLASLPGCQREAPDVVPPQAAPDYSRKSLPADDPLGEEDYLIALAIIDEQMGRGRHAICLKASMETERTTSADIAFSRPHPKFTTPDMQKYYDQISKYSRDWPIKLYSPKNIDSRKLETYGLVHVEPGCPSDRVTTIERPQIYRDVAISMVENYGCGQEFDRYFLKRERAGWKIRAAYHYPGAVFVTCPDISDRKSASIGVTALWPYRGR
ncbi:hypothetical protein [Sphingomonas sp. DBB INV C78]|uniref:hypothetical protein n=1 Tax=Sphingomonas sp. DBB INV C78 TaxID=3349434 RepID=UPI0036D389E5